MATAFQPTPLAFQTQPLAFQIDTNGPIPPESINSPSLNKCRLIAQLTRLNKI